MKLWVDDERPAPDETWLVATFSDEAKGFLRLARAAGTFIEEISLDHDLGGDDTGMKVLDWMIQENLWPKVLTIHTANPPARQQMLRAASAEAPYWVDIYIKYW